MHTWKSAADKQFWQKTLRLALPVSVQCMLFSVLGLVDILMVSQLGEAQVAAVGVGNRIFFFNLLMIVGASGAVSVLASQFFGAGNIAGVRRTLLQTWVCAIAFSIPFAILYSLMPQQIVQFVTDDSAFVEHATQYLLITGFSIIATAIVVPLEAAMRSVGEAKLPTRIGFVAVGINAALNALLIFGLFGFPELGVAGAAIGTTVSRFVQSAMLLWAAKRYHPQILPRRDELGEAWKPTARKKYMSVAMPMIIHDAGWAVGILVYNLIVGQLGVTELAIISLLSPIEGVLISAFIGFAVAAATLLGHELGAENYNRAFFQSWWLLALSVSLALLVALVVGLLSNQIEFALSLTNIPDLDMALKVTLVMALGLSLKVFNMVGIGGVLKSGGDIKYTIFIDLFAQWGVGIPLAFYTGLVLGWPLHMVMMVILVEEVVKIGLTVHRIYGKRWLKNLVSDEIHAEPNALAA
ncbi:MATE family efflux transporter [Thaumasiovibrio subtropicus]|uniref:MATE family efflux transporter n=1 Tax=Thaumasiovibrio subtropicus TaxID=1891207 RepID=UPI000B35DE29|nr:MATE family efflux transporter [Thaumasiovibrio subtropicus]